MADRKFLRSSGVPADEIAGVRAEREEDAIGTVCHAGGIDRQPLRSAR